MQKNIGKANRETPTERYIIDINVFKKYEGRLLWNDTLRKLKAMKAEIFIHTLYRVKYYATYHTHRPGREFFKNLLKDERVTMLNTSLNLQIAALDFDAKVLTNSATTAEICKKYGVKYVMLDEFLKKDMSKTKSSTIIWFKSPLK